MQKTDPHILLHSPAQNDTIFFYDYVCKLKLRIFQENKFQSINYPPIIIYKI